MKNLLIIFLSIMSFVSLGQQKITPGQVYNEGDELYAPKLGFTFTIPNGWMGILPQSSSIFLLSSTKGLDGEIYVLGDTTDFQKMRKGWVQGLEIEEGRVLKSDENIKEEDGVLISNVILTGTQNKSNAGFIAARCGNYGRCVAALLTCNARFLEEMKKGVHEFLASVVFEDPIMTNEYDGYDWNLF